MSLLQDKYSTPRRLPESNRCLGSQRNVRVHAPLHVGGAFPRGIEGQRRLLIATCDNPVTCKARFDHPAAKSWDDATPMEILEARVRSLEESLEHLKYCVADALRYGTVRSTTESDILDEEWSK